MILFERQSTLKLVWRFLERRGGTWLNFPVLGPIMVHWSGSEKPQSWWATWMYQVATWAWSSYRVNIHPQNIPKPKGAIFNSKYKTPWQEKRKIMGKNLKLCILVSLISKLFLLFKQGAHACIFLWVLQITESVCQWISITCNQRNPN